MIRTDTSGDLTSLLRRYAAIQAECRKLEAERNQLKNRIAAFMHANNVQNQDFVVDDELLRVRCQPRVCYKIDAWLLRQRLGRRYYTFLEPDTRRLKAHAVEVRQCLAPIIHKIGVPSGALLDQAIAEGRLDPALVDDAIVRTNDYAFAVSHPQANKARAA